MNNKEAARIRELKAQGYIPVKSLQSGQESTWKDDWDDEVMCPGTEIESVRREYEELSKRWVDRKPTAQSQEAAAEQYEKNMADSRNREARWLYQEELEEFVPGRILSTRQFLHLLKKIRPDAYYNKYAALGLRGVNFIENGLRFFGTTVQDMRMPEWSQMRFDRHGNPTTERFRGWRTALMALIDKNIITLEDAVRVFGEPRGKRAVRWKRTFYCQRNGLCPECASDWCRCKHRWEHLRADNYAYRGQ